MKYLTPQVILVIHAEIINETGGAHGVRDVGLLISLSERPRTAFGGKEVYKTVFDKAAAYLESLARYHVFVDGNKRTGIAISARFLFLNGFELIASNKEVEVFTLRAATQRLDISVMANWLTRHSRKV